MPSRSPISNGSAPGFDLMNDPIEHPKSQDEPDTCRICRGEGTNDEPLFYPCKCSGSIKFVHQECLMEWLSHSQKKHCELCKTSFRFTKLYHPNMPQQLPLSIFLKRAAMHTGKTILLWCRGLVVASVWLFWLPWITRFLWWCMFWLADGGWSLHGDLSRHRFNASSPTSSSANSSNSTTADHIFARFKSWPLATLGEIFMPPLSLRRSMFNGLASMSFSDANSGETLLDHNGTTYTANSQPKHDTLLSRLPLFYNLTPHRWLNKFITDILEGQIITFAVVIAAILIFLIREWVVQQQPVINLVAAQGALVEEAQAAQQAQEVHAEETENGESIPEGEGTAQASNGVDPEASTGRAVDPELMNDERVDQLIHEIENSHADLLLFSQKEDWQDASDDTLDRLTRAANIVERVQDTCIAFQQASKDALQRSDVVELRNLARGLARFQPALTHIPDSWSTSISECVAALEDCVNTLTNIIDGAETLDAAGGNTGSVASSHERPSMPDRDESSLATGIRRQLEEAGGGSNSEPITLGARYAQGAMGNQTAAAALPNDVGLGSSRAQEQPFGDLQRVQPSSANVPDRWDESSPTSEYSDIAQDLTQDRSAETLDTAVGNASNAEESDNGAASDGTDRADDQTEPHEELGFLNRVLDWIWADVGHPQPDADQDEVIEEDVVEEIAEEVDDAQEVHQELENNQAGDNQDAEVAAAAAQAGININDPDAADDVEDLEGILELIGMQGPILGLMQNAIFSCVLVAATVGCAVWVPYLWGKVVLMFLAHPIHFSLKVPVALINGLSNFLFDFGLFTIGFPIGSLAYWIKNISGFVSQSILGIFPSLAKVRPWFSLSDKILDLSEAALVRMVDVLNPDAPGPAYLYLSVSSHAALYQLRHSLRSAISVTLRIVEAVTNFVAYTPTGVLLDQTLEFVKRLFTSTLPMVVMVVTKTFSMTPKILHSTLHSISNTKLEYVVPADVELGRWTASDRVIAVFAGYVFFTMAGILYLRRGMPITSYKYEKTIMDILQQSGGVFKVIFIISIEMLLFPLYCGVLLDVAMLPLFENTTIESRMMFTMNSPWTSVFVHWFVGTCYMFHFALFVSMCRKMMRKGVLYFIRDPDDPTFHPVRDVLERTVQSQLRKIAFSGLVYGALVIVCMGSVVWALSYSLSGLLPIRWTPQSALGFPVDLLLYTSLVPLIAFLFRPSIGLHHVYEWWLKKSASFLRLSQFLFGVKVETEYSSAWTGNNRFQGRFVRAPGSDQVRIPRNNRVFLDVDSNNMRLDGKPDTDEGLHGRKSFTMVYVPPFFRFRIGLFCASLWILSAFTGLVATILPLVIGRSIFALLAPSAGKVNDLYAYAGGILISASLVYVVSSVYPWAKSVIQRAQNSGSSLLQPALYFQMAKAILDFSSRALRVLYTYGTALILLPTLFALILQLYILLPLSTYLALHRKPANDDERPTTTPSLHYLQIIQTWTLGLMYVRIVIRLVLLRRDTRPYLALRKITEQGWMNPNATVATRAFFLPIALISIIAIGLPIPIGRLGSTLLSASSASCEEDHICIIAMRFAYPTVMLACLATWALFSLVNATRRWRLRIRDEVYLIGERLHNYGEKRPPAHAKRFGDGGVEVDESGVAASAG